MCGVTFTMQTVYVLVSAALLCVLVVVQDALAWRRGFCVPGDTCETNDCCCPKAKIKDLCK